MVYTDVGRDGFGMCDVGGIRGVFCSVADYVVVEARGDFVQPQAVVGGAFDGVAFWDECCVGVGGDSVVRMDGQWIGCGVG